MSKQEQEALTAESQVVDGAPDTSIERGNGGAHMDEFVAAEFSTGPQWPDNPVEVNSEGDPVEGEDREVKKSHMSEDAFWGLFQGGFNVPGQLKPRFKPMGIQSGEAAHARAVSDAMYKLLAAYYPNALLPFSENLVLLFVVAPFFYMKALVVKGIFSEMREEREAKRLSGPASADPSAVVGVEVAAAVMASPMDYLKQDGKA